MNRKWVEVTRTRSERRVPRRVRPREGLEALCEHLNVRFELDMVPALIGSPYKRISVVPDIKEGK